MTLNSLTLRAKKSISGIFPALDTKATPEKPPAFYVPDDNKENEDPDLEEFGSRPSHTAVHSDSPSKRKKLLCSLQSMGSFRTRRASPQKVTKYIDLRSCSESPYTPARNIRPSITLDFQESPADKPMFDIPEPRRSMSTSDSVKVQFSSLGSSTPLSRQHAIPGGSDPTYSLLAEGTVPTSPAPIRKLFEAEMRAREDPSPETEGVYSTEPMQTPLPGTNLTFDDITPELSEPSSFDIPVAKDRDITIEDCQIQIGAATPRKNEVNNEVKVGNRVHDLLIPQNTASSSPSISPSRAYPRTPQNSLYPDDEISSDDDHDDHLIWLDHSKFGEDSHTSIEPDHAGTSKDSSTDNKTEIKHSTWRQHSGLYDGSGYGSDFGHEATVPAIEETSAQICAKPYPRKALSHTQVTSETRIPSNSASKVESTVESDRETLSDVIRAYAAFEAESTCASDEQACADDFDTASEQFETRVMENIALSDRIMDHSLGA